MEFTPPFFAEATKGIRRFLQGVRCRGPVVDLKKWPAVRSFRHGSEEWRRGWDLNPR